MYSAIDEDCGNRCCGAEAMISDFSVCQFTIDEVEAGIPKEIRYTMRVEK